MPWFYYVGRVLVRMALFLFTRWEVRGRENVPGEGPVFVLVNHLNLADPPVVAVSLGRKAIFMAKEELFRNKFSRYFISSFGAFPVYRGRLDKKTLQQAQSILAGGTALVMFPEGTRSKNTKLQPALPGSALIALRSGVPVLPVGITGTENIKGVGWLLRRPRITINIGPPFHLPAVNGKLTKTELTELTSLIMKRISELLPAEYQGHYAEQGKAT